MRWLYSRRMREAEKAWAEYCKVTGGASGEMPILFHAGFSMGVAAAQKAEQDAHESTVQDHTDRGER